MIANMSIYKNSTIDLDCTVFGAGNRGRILFFQNSLWLNATSIMLILLATPLSWQPQNIARRFDPI